jgi:chaperonin cofactor prefoldin
MAARKKKNLSKTLRKLSGSAVTKKEVERIKLSETVRKLSGAAVTKKELERIKKSLKKKKKK